MIGFTAEKLRQRDSRLGIILYVFHMTATFLKAGWLTCYHIIQFVL
jgi:hypothetical protein